MIVLDANTVHYFENLPLNQIRYMTLPDGVSRFVRNEVLLGACLFLLPFDCTLSAFNPLRVILAHRYLGCLHCAGVCLHCVA